VGETYFFRETHALDVFTEQILPPLIQARQQTSRSLRIWSAACCTGEEPYSLAILLRTRIPNIQDWNITIVGTDINTRFLKKAAEGVYSEWSFRATPHHYKERYFRRTTNGRFEIVPEIRRMVRFSQLNLAEDAYPSFINDTNNMDVIFCRNVFIYFSPERIHTAVQSLHRALIDRGWLIVSPSETAYLPSSLFEAYPFPGTIIHQKRAAFSYALSSPQESVSTSLLPLSGQCSPFSTALPLPCVATQEQPASQPQFASSPVPIATEDTTVTEDTAEQLHAPPPLTLYQEATNLYKEGRYAEVSEKLRSSLFPNDTRVTPFDPHSAMLLARSCANQGAWNEAITYCQKATLADPLNSRLYYLLATLLLEQGRENEALLSLKRTLYLDPDFALAHFTLANLARRQQRPHDVRRHLQNTKQALRQYRPDDLVPEAEGLTVGRLLELIATMLLQE
jgi:chemotaxis protein methyltransferase CheR